MGLPDYDHLWLKGRKETVRDLCTIDVHENIHLDERRLKAKR